MGCCAAAVAHGGRSTTASSERRHDGRNERRHEKDFSMSAAHVSLVLADVDGTIVTSAKALTQRTIAAVRALDDAGVALAVASGRPPRGMAMLIEPLNLRTPMAGFNGGVLVNPDLSVIESRKLDPDAAERALRLVLNTGLDAWVFTEEDWLVRDEDADYVPKEAQTLQFAPKRVAAFTDAHLGGAVKIVGVSKDFDAVEACEAEAQKLFGESITARRSQPYYLDITDKGANKGAALQRISNLLRIPSRRIATIGDMSSDVPMFRDSGLSIAMGNASDEVKAQATATTDANDADGFAEAMEQLVLHRRKNAPPLSERKRG